MIVLLSLFTNSNWSSGSKLEKNILLDLILNDEEYDSKIEVILNSAENDSIYYIIKWTRWKRKYNSSLCIQIEKRWTHSTSSFTRQNCIQKSRFGNN